MTGAAKVRHIAPGYAELVGYLLLGKPSGVVQPEHEFPIVLGKPSGVHCCGRARNVRPGLSGHNGADRSLSKAIVGTNRPLCLTIRASLPDNHNIRFGELGLRMKGAWTWGFTASCSSLLRAILHVVLLCPGKQVLWVYAGWVIARVADVLSVWNRTITKLVHDSMGQPVLSVDSNNAVSERVAGGGP